MTLLSVDNLTIRPNGKSILENVSFRIDPGEIVTIVGPNGSGKSTLLKAIIGAVPISSGAVQTQPGLRIGYVPQKLHIDTTFPMTVARFLEQKPGQMADPDVAPLANQQMTDLSGGQFQRVLLAHALRKKPHLLILDEATQGLDQAGSAAFYTRIETIRRDTGCAVLMVSHELHVVMSASDRVICLNGHVCCHGTPEIVASAPEYRALFGSGTLGALALYRHQHDHAHHDNAHHDHTHHDHDHPHHDHSDLTKAD